MILGIGMDVVHLDGFQEQLQDSSSEFVNGTFTMAERRAANARPSAEPTRHLAARFAAKEAFIKAWSSAHFGRTPALSGVDWREIEVVNDSFGRPALVLHGRVAAAVSQLGSTRTHLSLSHDGPMAAAYVILEQVQHADTNLASVPESSDDDAQQTDRPERRTA